MDFLRERGDGLMTPEMTAFFDIVVDVVERLLIAVTPCITAYLAYRSNKKEKEDKKYRKLREDNEKLEKQLRDQKDNDTAKAIKDLQSSVEKITEDVQALREAIDIDKINKQLAQLVKISNINMEYSQSLSNVIMAIGEGIQDSELIKDDKIREALEQHREIDHAVCQKLYKVIY